MFRVVQTMTGWEIRDTSDQPHGHHQRYDRALGAVAVLEYRHLTAADGEAGLLPERWVDSEGVAFAEPTGPHRDFTGVAWSWRDPAVGLVPLMLQTQSQPGHLTAELAGFVESFSEMDGTVHAAGRFYDTDAGRQFRDLLLAGRTFGVSADPSEHVDSVDICPEDFALECDTRVTAYEIAGLTGVPFPGFARAAIRLDEGQSDEQEAVAASAATVVPPAPPIEWFADPQLTEPTAFTVQDDGRIVGHLATWGTCHISYNGSCVSAPVSAMRYAYFHTGELQCADGARVAVGTLTLGTGHAPLQLDHPAAVQHYDNTGTAVADIVVGEDVHGIWIAGAARPDLTEHQMRSLRASAPSGDWRRIGTSLELVAALCVNVPGFPVPRTQARVASGQCVALIAAAAPLGAVDDEARAELDELRKEVAVQGAVLQPLLRMSADAHLAVLRGD